ncbi:MAG: ECF-type sigma factor, partial [Planctomycetota bacterium]
MAEDQSGAVTRLLTDESLDDGARAQQLLPLVYDRLRAIAQQRMAGERVGHTLQATALVHEAYARLVGNQELNWDSRGHFFTAAAEAMRRILIEHARARARVKRGGDGDAWRRVPLSVVDLAESGNSEEILILDDVFRRLQDVSPELADVVRLRFFAGLSV